MPGGCARETKSSEAAFLSEVFHNLSQPLTALHCTLDLALQRDRTLKQLRASVQSALDDAERLRQRLLLMRALNDAGAPGELLEVTDLSALLRELGDDMSPLFASAGRRFELDIRCQPLLVRADNRRLMRALFAFVEYLFRYLPEGALLSIGLDRGKAGEAEMHIDAASCLPVGPESGNFTAPYSCETELVRRTFQAAGGRFVLLSCASDRSVWLGTLPRP